LNDSEEECLVTHVFVVQHLREDPDGYDNVKLIGIYSTRENAAAAIKRLSNLSGFAEAPDGFSIDRYEVDKDDWAEGFVDLSTP
jgi:hypothetical protein